MAADSAAQQLKLNIKAGATQSSVQTTESFRKFGGKNHFNFSRKSHSQKTSRFQRKFLKTTQTQHIQPKQNREQGLSLAILSLKTLDNSGHSQKYRKSNYRAENRDKDVAQNIQSFNQTCFTSSNKFGDKKTDISGVRRSHPERESQQRSKRITGDEVTDTLSPARV